MRPLDEQPGGALGGDLDLCDGVEAVGHRLPGVDAEVGARRDRPARGIGGDDRVPVHRGAAMRRVGGQRDQRRGQHAPLAASSGTRSAASGACQPALGERARARRRRPRRAPRRAVSCARSWRRECDPRCPRVDVEAVRRAGSRPASSRGGARRRPRGWRARRRRTAPGCRRPRPSARARTMRARRPARRSSPSGVAPASMRLPMTLSSALWRPTSSRTSVELAPGREQPGRVQAAGALERALRGRAGARAASPMTRRRHERPFRAAAREATSIGVDRGLAADAAGRRHAEVALHELGLERAAQVHRDDVVGLLAELDVRAVLDLGELERRAQEALASAGSPPRARSRCPGVRIVTATRTASWPGPPRGSRAAPRRPGGRVRSRAGAVLDGEHARVDRCAAQWWAFGGRHCAYSSRRRRGSCTCW